MGPPRPLSSLVLKGERRRSTGTFSCRAGGDTTRQPRFATRAGGRRCSISKPWSESWSKSPAKPSRSTTTSSASSSDKPSSEKSSIRTTTGGGFVGLAPGFVYGVVVLVV